MKTIAFYSKQLCVRGTSVALYDYADYNEKILNNKTLILLDNNSKHNNRALKKFTNRFDIIYVDNDIEEIIKCHKIEIIYYIRYGKNEGLLSNNVKNVVHCVFDMTEPHGDVYAAVSESLAKKFNKPLFVPHMISLKKITDKNLKSFLNIPENSIVFGRYGGEDTFNLEFCWRAIQTVLSIRSDIFFLFANTPIVIKHPNIKYLDKISSEYEKNLFINTCDAHLECGKLGHSFGLSIGEFSVFNKPIIAYKKPSIRYDSDYIDFWNDEHIKILGEDGIYFTSEKEFLNILLTFKKENYNRDINKYKEYTPEKVMEIFKKIFID